MPAGSARASSRWGFSQDASGNACNDLSHFISPVSDSIGNMPFVHVAQFSAWDCICLLGFGGKVTARAFLFSTKELLVFKNYLQTAGQVFDLTVSVRAVLLVQDNCNRGLPSQWTISPMYVMKMGKVKC